MQILGRSTFFDLKELVLDKYSLEEFMWTQLESNDHDIIVEDIRPLAKVSPKSIAEIRFDNDIRIIN